MTDTEKLIAVTKRLTGLPPDPDGMNDKRAGWADDAISTYMLATGSDMDVVMADMLSDLMHWCDRNETDFNDALVRATRHYGFETSPQL